jgi:Arc/MetJ family transcription regulator
LKYASSDAIFDAATEAGMRTTVTIDDDLLKTAAKDTGISERGPLLDEALRALIRREAGRRLIELGGTMPDLEDIPRRRQDPA